MTENKILFSIPGFSRNYELNLIFLDLFNKERSKFYEDVVIDSVFDSFAAPWSGGRPHEKYTPAGEMFASMMNFNTRGISIRHAFNNMCINKNHLGDITGNAILKITSELDTDVPNGCTINSPDLFDYIKENYPKLYCVWSTTKEISDIDTINKLSKDNLLVLSYTFNNDFEQLSKLKYPENIEILCSEEGCVENCPQRNNHQLITSKLNMLDLSAHSICLNCPSRLTGTPTYYYNSVSNRAYFISIDDIRTKYLPRGFNKFKISGRSGKDVSIINTIENYVMYFVKPEFKDEIRNKLLIDYYSTINNKSIPFLF